MKTIYKWILFLTILFYNFSIFPQATDTKNNINHKQDAILAEETPSDYLDKHIISKRIHLVKEDIEKNMRRLARVIRYFESAVPNSKQKYDELAADYKKALEFYYSGDSIKAYNTFLSIRPRLNELSSEFVKVYRQKTTEISSEIFDRLSQLQEDSINAPHFIIHETELRLNVMRSKIEEANDMARFQKNLDVINLLRNAKIIGIMSLYHLETQKEKKEEILKKYKLDLEDANYTTLKFE